MIRELSLRRNIHINCELHVDASKLRWQIVASHQNHCWALRVVERWIDNEILKGWGGPCIYKAGGSMPINGDGHLPLWVEGCLWMKRRRSAGSHRGE